MEEGQVKEILFLLARYQLLHNFNIEMNVGSKIKELEFMNRDTIALITVLRNLHTTETVIICNTHLLFNMKRGEIKLGIELQAF